MIANLIKKLKFCTMISLQIISHGLKYNIVKRGEWSKRSKVERQERSGAHRTKRFSLVDVSILLNDVNFIYIYIFLILFIIIIVSFRLF